MAYQTRTTRSSRGGSAQQSSQLIYPQQQVAADFSTTSGNTGYGSVSGLSSYNTAQTPQPIQTTQQAQKPAAQAGTPMQSLSAAAAALAATMTKLEPEEEMDEVMAEAGKNGEEESKWKKNKMRNKEPAFKVSKKVKRKRMNARLRRILQPKNAIMVLNELKESVKFTFLEQTSPMQQNFFIVTVEVDGQTYQGQGLSKPAAKQNAAENALKALLLEKMAQSAQGLDGDGEVAMKDESSMELGPPGTDVPPGEEPPLLDEEGKPVGRQTQQPEDDVPWGSLASFALFKLFNDWQSQGAQLPLIRPGGSATGHPGEVGASSTLKAFQDTVMSTLDLNGLLVQSRGPAPMKKLPDNPTERHPVMLLNQLRPSLVFNDVSMQGLAPNVVFTMSVTVDGVPYQGMGKNKKEAKKEAAKSALAAVFNIHYDN